jgi:hypothetical protein
MGVDPFAHLRAAENHKRAVNHALDDLSKHCALVELAERRITMLIDRLEELGVSHDEIRRAAAQGVARCCQVTTSSANGGGV